MQSTSKVDAAFFADFKDLVERYGFQFTDFLDLIRVLSSALKQDIIMRNHFKFEDGNLVPSDAATASLNDENCK